MSCKHLLPACSPEIEYVNYNIYSIIYLYVSHWLDYIQVHKFSTTAMWVGISLCINSDRRRLIWSHSIFHVKILGKNPCSKLKKYYIQVILLLLLKCMSIENTRMCTHTHTHHTIKTKIRRNFKYHNSKNLNLPVTPLQTWLRYFLNLFSTAFWTILSRVECAFGWRYT